MTQPQLIGIIITAAIQITIFVIIILMYKEIKSIKKTIAPNISKIEELIYIGEYETAKKTLLKNIYRDTKKMEPEEAEPGKALEKRYKKYLNLLNLNIDFKELKQNIDKPYTESFSEKQ